MTTAHQFQEQARTLIDDLKAVCARFGLGNDAAEFKIITQVFLYKFLNDKFAYKAKQIEPALAQADSWEEAITELSDNDFEMLTMQLGAGTAKLQPQHFLATLFASQDKKDFHKTFDATLIDIAALNSEVFSVRTAGGSRIQLFDRVTEFISDPSQRDPFAKALINKLITFSFEHIFAEGFDFYSTLFEYLIKDYNSDAGGKYAEYYTPHAVAKIMAAILVPSTGKKLSSVSCYDPAAGSGTLLMNLAHAIGEDRCAIYTQDISQKSSGLLRLNLILNNLVHSIPNVIQGNTISEPYPFHLKTDGAPEKFDFIVSNPPFKLDFSDYRDDLDTKANKERFFAGLPNVPKKAKDKMAIYQLFLQHIVTSLAKGGRAAVVVPTGFLTAQSGIDKKIRQHLVENKMLAGVVSMPSNIFATTGTNVSILFIDDNNDGDVVLLDASKLGKKVKEGKNEKTLLSAAEEEQIIGTFNEKKAVEDLSVVVNYEQIAAKNFSMSAGQYFEVKIEYVDISPEEFASKLNEHKNNLNSLFQNSRLLAKAIDKELNGLKL
ncbi:HsdM family class I SAM-dependent methyltransferase [Roseibacillus persicicus]|uniref:HsdM family class I SAM-dependent methyltransferase n=1 Tax=Roseibacillus persicicus TaxID=454148 RepID=UPI00280E4061|nr:class I SAM-dependent DNA methyltransferase [Roseibacillus persicicus]MDQ8189541.1 class I SAM-dependent DNA methyltransferase [Roseibacillus persicicus]